MILCAAGDPGGSRVVLPVMLELERRGLPCRILDHGYLGRELPARLRPLLIPDGDAGAVLEEAACYVFGSSASDARPLGLARAARASGLPVAHILDNWSGYASRLEHDGLGRLTPDIYAVMDEEAKLGAIADGVPEECLRITGHPGLGELTGIVRLRREAGAARRKRYDLPEGKLHLVFVNEPLRQVLGHDIAGERHCGFTEDQVLALWARSLQAVRDRVFATILPHPKDDPRELAESWSAVRGGVPGRVMRLPKGREILSAADAVAGMASILLYDSWLLGLPTLALQPGVRQEPIRRFSRLPGLHYADSGAGVDGAVRAWLSEADSGSAALPRQELQFHLQAPARIAKLIGELLK
ncbi:MAG: hypothetical protein LBT97_02685 [Planctomycetota bacterium]|jgi:hypothetical protein|nr:hypothetical protein [Planctomycetota bacterium]